VHKGTAAKSVAGPSDCTMVACSNCKLLLSVLLSALLLVSYMFAFVPSRSSSRRHACQTSNSRTSPLVLRESILDRFKSPKIDDPALPLSEAGIAQIIAPSLEIFWTVAQNAPYPTWARPLSDGLFPLQGSFLAPTLLHGAGLACCWLAGCLAAKSFEKDAFQGNFPTVVLSTVKAGAFATGLLIFATQADLYFEMGGYVQLGESPETDARILTAAVEVINDVVFEASTLILWRLYRSTVV
jgi:hypothetical protein